MDINIIGKTELNPNRERACCLVSLSDRLTSDSGLWQGVLFAILFCVSCTKTHSLLWTTSQSGQDKRSSGTFSLLLLFRLSIQLCRLWSAQDFVVSGITLLAVHRKSSSLVRGSNCCGGFSRCVASLFNVSINNPNYIM